MKRRRDSASESEPLATPKKPKMSIDTEPNQSSTSHSAKGAPTLEYGPSIRQTSLPASEVLTGSRSVSKPAQPTSSIKKKRAPRNRSANALKRSVSTPHLPTGDTRPESPDSEEKRRNKLGYHRTSVACGHCRRRKIRCQLDPHDSQGRCTNCLRLKKECNYYPVEQTGGSESHVKPSKSGSASGGRSIASSSTPPPHSAPLTAQSDPFSQYSHIPTTSPYEFAIPSNTRGGLGIFTSHTDQASIGYAQQFDTPDTWEPKPYSQHAPAHPAMSDQSGNPLADYWKAQDPKAAMVYPQYEMPFSQPIGSHSALPYLDHRSDAGWLGSTHRSMSLGHIEHLQRDYSPQPRITQGARPRPSTLITNTPSLGTSGNSSNASLSEAASVPLSAPIGGQLIPHYAFHQPWSPYGTSQLLNTNESKTPDVYQGEASWFQEPGPLEQVSEETGDPEIGFELQHAHSHHEQYPTPHYSDYPNYTGARNPG